MKYNIPVNVVDELDKCSFTITSIFDRSPLIVVVSSSGKSPTLSKYIRRKIEAMLPPSYGPLAEMIGEFRQVVLKMPGSYSEKNVFWNAFFLVLLWIYFFQERRKMHKGPLNIS